MMSAFSAESSGHSQPVDSLPPPPAGGSQNDDSDDGAIGGKKKKSAKRRKVNHACLYCRRSHMTCDEGRPCQRCIKREIGHLCHDERRPSKDNKPPSAPASASLSASSSSAPPAHFAVPPPPSAYPSQPMPSTVPPPGAAVPAWPSMSVPQGAYNMYQLESFGKEFSVLSDFLDTLDEQAFFNPPPGVMPPPAPYTTNAPAPPQPPADPPQSPTVERADPASSASAGPLTGGPMSKTERFLLTAADQEPGTRDERLKRVIRSKYEAGLLKPYNYVKGYARLSRWMDRNVSQDSKQQILQPLSVLRPKFRAVAQSLRDIDLVFIEEAFERLLLDYDRVFSAMGIPACLWRRTGEIYKGNREFAELVGVEGYMLRDGRLCIYELMAEESAVNYWEKYGNVAFNSTQKAVLTSCVLRFKPLVAPASGPATPGRPLAGAASAPSEEGFINCCFSFTIRRDTWGIPSMIVGNFIRC